MKPSKVAAAIAASLPRAERGVVMMHTEPLVRSWPTLSPLEREMLVAMHDHYDDEFSRLRDNSNQEWLAAGMHDLADDALKRQNRKLPEQAARVRCARGCSHCCRQNVTITKPEAHLLIVFAKLNKLAIDWERVDRQAKVAPADWHDQPREDRACVFLNEQGECRVYEHRPTACRKYAVVSEPADCDIEKHRGRKVAAYICLEAEVVASAALGVFEKGSMPAMLWRALREMYEGQRMPEGAP